MVFIVTDRLMRGQVWMFRDMEVNNHFILVLTFCGGTVRNGRSGDNMSFVLCTFDVSLLKFHG